MQKPLINNNIENNYIKNGLFFTFKVKIERIFLKFF